MSGNIRILIVDDHGMVRFGLRGYIETMPCLQVVGEAASGEEALQLMQTLEVDIVLMDLVLPGISGAEADAHYRRLPPQYARDYFDEFSRRRTRASGNSRRGSGLSAQGYSAGRSGEGNHCRSQRSVRPASESHHANRLQPCAHQPTRNRTGQAAE